MEECIMHEVDIDDAAAGAAVDDAVAGAAVDE